MRRPLLIGESPSDLAASALGPRTTSGARLDRLLRGHGFDAVSLLARALGPADEWPTQVARCRARQLYETVLAGREVVLLGRRVARGFHGLTPHLDVLHGAPYFSRICPTVPARRGRWDRCIVWLSPHPSGRSRWWNEASHRAQAAAFFSRVLGLTEFPIGPELPSYVAPPEEWECLAETRSWPRSA